MSSVSPTLLAIVAIVLLAQPAVAQGDAEAVRGAYYIQWGVYGREFCPADMPFEDLTHVFYAFVDVNDAGDVRFTDPLVDFDDNGSLVNDAGGWLANWGQCCGRSKKPEDIKPEYRVDCVADKPLPDTRVGSLAWLKKAGEKRNPTIKLLLSVGGWTWSGNFHAFAKSAQARERFATQIWGHVKDIGYHGVDIDWEFPVHGGNGIPQGPEDTKNYGLLVEKLHEKKPEPNYLITAAVTGNPFDVVHFPVAKLKKYLDFINLMVYDYHGGWEETTNGHNAPLFTPPYDKSKFCIHDGVQAWVNAGMPRNKLVLGTPQYARGWNNVQCGSSEGHGLDDMCYLSPGTIPLDCGGIECTAGIGSWEAGVWDLDELFSSAYSEGGGLNHYWSKYAYAPWMHGHKSNFNKTTGSAILVGFENKQSNWIKGAYAKDQHLRGVFSWEPSGDTDNRQEVLKASHAGFKAGCGPTAPGKECGNKDLSVDKPAKCDRAPAPACGSSCDGTGFCDDPKHNCNGPITCSEVSDISKIPNGDRSCQVTSCKDGSSVDSSNKLICANGVLTAYPLNFCKQDMPQPEPSGEPSPTDEPQPTSQPTHMPRPNCKNRPVRNEL